MAQRKKKPSGHQLEAIAKAHQKNEFLRKLKHFINNCCGKDIFSLIPPIHQNAIYLMRCHSLALVPAAGDKVPIQLLTFQKRVLSDFLKKERLEIKQYRDTLSFDDFLTVGLTAFYLPERIKEGNFPNASEVRSALLEHCHGEDYIREFLQRLQVFFETLIWVASDLRDFLIWLNYEIKPTQNGKLGLNNIAEIHIVIPETIRIKTDGKIRPALRLCWANSFTGILLPFLKPSLLGIDGGKSDDPMPVYFQSHVLRRLLERIDSIRPGIAQFNMYASFNEPKVYFDSYHNLMIEYRIFETKAGYFRIDVIDGKVLVRTFLFITQSGTPEGQLLAKNTGLQKLDTSYLAIDKLSSFMSSDIGSNIQLRKIFQEAGCQCLFELYEKIDVLTTKHPSQSTCCLMLDYLGYNNVPVSEEEFV